MAKTFKEVVVLFVKETARLLDVVAGADPDMSSPSRSDWEALSGDGKNVMRDFNVAYERVTGDMKARLAARPELRAKIRDIDADTYQRICRLEERLAAVRPPAKASALTEKSSAKPVVVPPRQFAHHVR